MSNCISKFAVFEYLKHDWNFRIFLQFKLYVKSIEVTKTAFLTISAAVNLDFFNFWHFQFEISKIKGLKSNCDIFFSVISNFFWQTVLRVKKKWRWLRKKMSQMDFNTFNHNEMQSLWNGQNGRFWPSKISLHWFHVKSEWQEKC